MEDRRPSSSSSSSCTGALCNGKVDSECGDINLKSIMGEGVDGHDGIVVYQAHENDEAVMCVVQGASHCRRSCGTHVLIATRAEFRCELLGEPAPVR